jgi:putative colanic acid biosynthesis UDP-glucose lipid carrier transferase
MKKIKRYSGLITPLSFLIDITFVIFFMDYYISLIIYKTFQFNHIVIISCFWVFISVFNGFYQIYRYTSFEKVIRLIFNQLFFFTLSLFAFSGIFTDLEMIPIKIVKYALLIFIFVSFVKILTFFSLKKFRSYFGGNYRKTIVIGHCTESTNLEKYFKLNKDAGYLHKHSFNDPSHIILTEIFSYILEHEIDEVYCSLKNVDDRMVKSLIDYCDNNLITIKFIPQSTKIYSKKLIFDNYDTIPILSLRKVPLKDNINKFFKRLFDIIISLVVIILILSWLTPILALLIKSQSRGPVFFRQIRNGINYKEFYCYKFRSMVVNNDADKTQATRHDVRVTPLGKLLRKSSLDEMPQFINVLFGEMSVVGPRPHMTKENNKYNSTVQKYMLRHVIKPGITGYAQVNGFRGEVENESDIINRVKCDIYYLENWSLLLDVKIMFKTIINSIVGEDKAY